MTLLSIFIAVLALVAPAIAHNIALRANTHECFHETLHTDDQMTVTFQVGDREFGGSGSLEIDFFIRNPKGGYQVHERSVSQGEHSFAATMDGKYIYCFSNEHWAADSKEVTFNVYGVVYVAETEMTQDPLEKAVRKLSEDVARVKGEQGYIVARERIHRNTAESTNSRVKWWNISQISILFAVSAFQIWWIRRFFEVKRIV